MAGTGEDVDADEGFSPDHYAVPVGYMSGTVFTSGTAFLGRNKGVVAMYTAAHNMYGKNPVATFKWDGWVQRIGVYPDFDAKAVGLEAFTVTALTAASPYVIAANLPNFSWAPEPGTRYMRDAVRFYPERMAALLKTCVERFEVVDLDNSVHQLSTSDHLSCVGFPLPPTLPASGKWPYYPPDRREGNFIRYTQGHIQADLATIPGFSGGPVFTDDGRFAGMLVGTNPEPGSPYEIARIITPQNIISL